MNDTNLEYLKLLIEAFSGATETATNGVIAWFVYMGADVLLGYIVGTIALTLAYKVALHVTNAIRDSSSAVEKLRRLRNIAVPHSAFGEVTAREFQLMEEYLANAVKNK